MKVARLVRALVLALALALCCSAPALATTSPSMMLSFDGNFDPGNLSQWTPNSGGAQCANYRVLSSGYHQRGNLYFDHGVVGEGTYSARVDLPANVAPYTTSVCEALHPVSQGLGTDAYYGDMYYVPRGWTPGTSAFWGVGVAQFHFDNVWGSPVGYEMHSDHITLALETGPCQSVFTSHPGCQYKSNADLRWGPNLPAYYVVPPGAFVPGQWYEIIMHVHWAANSTGQVQTWYRVKGASSWIPTANVSGIPTVQWNAGRSVPTGALDKVGAYRGFSTAPISVWIDNPVDGVSFQGIAATMP